MVRRLGLIADVLQVVTCLVVLGVALKVYTANQRPAQATAPPTYSAGDRIDGLPTVRFDAKPLTALLFEQSTCRYCTQSMPFYVRLLDAAKIAGVQFVVASKEPVQVSETYVRGHGLMPDQVVQVPQGLGRFNRTPTLLLVDSRGIVRSAWLGMLDERGEQEVLRMLRRQHPVSN